MLRLQNQIRGYAWGSREFIARVQGRPFPTAGPEAELWIGAHPDSPSAVDGNGTLDELIATAPATYLGAGAVARFGPRLPYLMKLLAAQEPLSLQAHPDAEQARAAHAAGHPSYIDPFHKPELMLALRDFEALCGFREPTKSAESLRAMGIASLAEVIEVLERGDLREAMTRLLSWPVEDRDRLIEAVAAADPLAARLAEFYPGDLGVVVSQLLNHVTLSPGEAIWMPARTLHAYIEGAGIEVMASSDNVLRGGLTRKPVDVAELVRVLHFEPSALPILAVRDLAPGVQTWDVPVPDFRLTRVRCAGGRVEIDPAGPRTVLCLNGRVTVADAGGEITLGGGESAFGAACGGMMAVTGTGDVFVTSL